MLELSGVFMADDLRGLRALWAVAAAMRDKVVGQPAVMAWLRRSFAAAFRGAGRQARLDRTLTLALSAGLPGRCGCALVGLDEILNRA
jgi:hypothetical protein